VGRPQAVDDDPKKASRLHLINGLDDNVMTIG
jgi:hypothetical protein